MDIKAYIESGIIESYVLGLASAEEAAELESLCLQYPALKQALNEFEAQMEIEAFNNAIAPPPEVKGRLMDLLKDEFAEDGQYKKIIAPVIPIGDEVSVQERPISFWKYLAAASVILLIGSAALNVYLYKSYNETSTKYQALLTERNTLQANNDVFRTKLDDFEKSFRITQNPDFLKVALDATANKPGNLAAVYWNQKTQEVYFLPTQLEKVPEGKQYQLWAIVNGKPVNAGLVADCNGLCKMENISSAQAFAITLENKGGSKTPTLEAMYVVGEVKI